MGAGGTARPFIETPDPVLSAMQRSAIGLVAGYAIWTVFCHTLVLAAASFQSLLSWGWLGLLLSLLAAFYMARSPSAALDQRSLLTVDERPGLFFGRWWLVVPIVALLLLMAYRLSGSYSLFWLSLVLLLGIAAFFVLWRGTDAQTVSMQVAAGGTVVLVCAVLMALYALLHDAQNLDDTFHLNLIVGLLDRPDMPMMRWDTLSGIEGLPIMNTAYSSLSLEPLQALLVGYFDLDSLALRQFFFAPISAMLSVVFIALFLRQISPDQWPYVLISCLLLIFIWAVEFRMMGGFYFDFLSLGKQVLVAAIVPALAWQCMRWYARSRCFDWAVLMLLNIAAVGLSPNGIYVAPLTVGLISLAYLRIDVPVMRSILLSYAACFYPVLVGLLLILQGDVSSSEATGSMPIQDSLRSSMGWDWRYWVLLLMLSSGWVFFRHRSQQLLLLLWGLAFWAVIANPWLNGLWADYVTGNLNWRLTWAFPLLMILALSLHALAGRLMPVKTLVPAALLLVTLLPGDISAIAPRQLVGAFHLTYKVPGEEYRIAGKLVNDLNPNSVVLAPKELAAYVPSYRGHPQVLVSRPLYLFHQRANIPVDDLYRRALLYSLVAPEEVGEGALKNLWDYLAQQDRPVPTLNAIFTVLGTALLAGELDVVAFKTGSRHAQGLTQQLTAAGYRERRDGAYLIWYRKAPD